ncbi:MAG: alpha/beta hydrolase [Caulobacteraceae bacterium]
MPFGQIEALEHDGVQLAHERIEGVAPTFVWLGGFKSDMSGTKAQTLASWAHETGQAFVRFDYSGHGQSGGAFEDGTISRWLGDPLAVLDQLTSGPLVLVGSSMGGWLALLAARARPERIAGLVLIAPAADFTERLMWPGFTPEQQQRLMSEGRVELPSQYAHEPTIITRAMIEDGRKLSVMDAPFPFAGPVRIMAGGEDPDVPLDHVMALVTVLQTDDMQVHAVSDGDHRLSRPQDLEQLVEIASDLSQRLAR